MLCASLDGREFGGRMDKCICIADSLHSSPETITILLTGIPQYKMLSVLKNKVKK